MHILTHFAIICKQILWNFMKLCACLDMVLLSLCLIVFAYVGACVARVVCGGLFGSQPVTCSLVHGRCWTVDHDPALAIQQPTSRDG